MLKLTILKLKRYLSSKISTINGIKWMPLEFSEGHCNRDTFFICFPSVKYFTKRKSVQQAEVLHAYMLYTAVKLLLYQLWRPKAPVFPEMQQTRVHGFHSHLPPSLRCWQVTYLPGSNGKDSQTVVTCSRRNSCKQEVSS